MSVPLLLFDAWTAARSVHVVLDPVIEQVLLVEFAFGASAVLLTRNVFATPHADPALTCAMPATNRTMPTASLNLRSTDLPFCNVDGSVVRSPRP